MTTASDTEILFMLKFLICKSFLLWQQIRIYHISALAIMLYYIRLNILGSFI